MGFTMCIAVYKIHNKRSFKTVIKDHILDSSFHNVLVFQTMHVFVDMTAHAVISGAEPNRKPV